MRRAVPTSISTPDSPRSGTTKGSTSASMATPTTSRSASTSAVPPGRCRPVASSGSRRSPRSRSSAWQPSGEVVHDAWTTVGHWRGYGSAEHDGLVLGQRAHSWRQFLDLPSRTTENLLPALAIHSGEKADIAALKQSGWSWIDPADVASTPNQYRDFVRGSKGELCIAKQGYVVTNSGWFSDRSACYLAAGLPVVAQDTGWTAHLPTGEGLWTFGGADEVVALFDGIQGSPSSLRQIALHARALAQDYLSGRVVGSRFIDAAGEASDETSGRSRSAGRVLACSGSSRIEDSGTRHVKGETE